MQFNSNIWLLMQFESNISVLWKHQGRLFLLLLPFGCQSNQVFCQILKGERGAKNEKRKGQLSKTGSLLLLLFKARKLFVEAYFLLLQFATLLVITNNV